MPRAFRYIDNNIWLWVKVNAQARWDLFRSDHLVTPGKFDEVDCYCTFIGYPRSGHSVVGSVLDAHPQVVISHRLDALKYAGKGASIEKLFYLIQKNSERFAKSGRHLTAYSYALPGQGTAERLTVVGDQEGKHAARRLHGRPDMLSTLFAANPIKLRFIHVIRNPFDNIATMANRTQRPLARVIDDYFELCSRVLTVKSTYGDSRVLDVHHEDFVEDPVLEITRLCGFLDLPASPTWVRRCAEVVYKNPNRSRQSQDWSNTEICTVRSGMAHVPYLARYRSDNVEGA